MCLMFFLCCKEKTDQSKVASSVRLDPIVESSQKIGSTIKTRFTPPQGYKRKLVDSTGFAFYLRDFPLLDPKEKVHLFDGSLKYDQSVHASILDIDVGNRDLQQCADAVMRLRSEYLYNQQKYSEIAFNFTNGWKFEYSKWRAGNDLVVKGNKTNWKTGGGPKESYNDFRKYLDWVFMFAGTLSLSKELKSKKISDLEIGDIFIKGGSPGHAVLVVDLAVNEVTGDKAFLLAQSYMPAQQIHILKNPVNSRISPWYLLSEIQEELYTPEWTFKEGELMSF